MYDDIHGWFNKNISQCEFWSLQKSIFYVITYGFHINLFAWKYIPLKKFQYSTKLEQDLLFLNYGDFMRILFQILLTISLVVFTNGAQAAKLISKGDTILFSKADLENKDNIQTIEWSQNMSKRKEQYVQLTAISNTEEPFSVMFFVNKAYINVLSKSCVEDNCSVKIDDRFQYGQNTEQTLRFLVLHDKNNAPFQHRFLSTNTLTTFANGAQSAAKVATKMGVIVPQAAVAGKASDEMISNLKGVVGDPLRDF